MDNGKLKQPNKEKLRQPDLSAETPVFAQGIERQPGIVPENNPEQLGTSEQAVAETNVPNLAPVAPPQTTTQSTDDNIASSSSTIDDQSPGSAQDGDKLEKEWVIKTEKVIERTQQDPKQEEIETNKLKADYLAKRFNRHLGDRNS